MTHPSCRPNPDGVCTNHDPGHDRHHLGGDIWYPDPLNSDRVAAWPKTTSEYRVDCQYGTDEETT